MTIDNLQAIYEAAGTVTETEARTLLAKAKEYVARVRQQLFP